MGDLLRKGAEIADQLGELIEVVYRHVEKPGNVFKTADALGRLAEVTVAIPRAGIGEITLKIGEGVESYPARSAHKGVSFERGTKVRVVDIANQMMYVEDANTVPSEPETK